MIDNKVQDIHERFALPEKKRSVTSMGSEFDDEGFSSSVDCIDGSFSSEENLRRRFSSKSDSDISLGSSDCSLDEKELDCASAPLSRSESIYENEDENIDNCKNCVKNNIKEYDSCVTSDVETLGYKRFIPVWVANILKEPEYTMLGDGKKQKHLIHRHADSLFSTSSGFTNYRGLLNLGIILLVLANARLFLENILKYGILIDPIAVLQVFLSQPYSWPNVCLVIGANCFILPVFFTECLLSKERISEKVGFVINVTVLSSTLVVPAVVILYLHPNPMFSCITCGLYSMSFLKLVSYVSVNKWCRQKKAEIIKTKRRKTISMSEPRCFQVQNGKEETRLVSYPDNLKYDDMYYFMVAPTLCYELNFPRSLRVRKRFLLKRVLEMMFLSQLMMGLIQQWIIPTVHNSMKPLQDMEISRVLERLLKLAVPNHLIWLIFFYWFFHSSLNVCAELIRFGDREFYKDWWNSESINTFWQLWNVPVHRWCVRHLYKPLVRRGCSKHLASVAVFALSAFFHEYIISIPLRMFRIWAFSAMLGQVPLAMFVSKYLHGQYGNMAVWLSLILGQPIAIFAYFHDYYMINMQPVLQANHTMAG